jgi:hypoxanthine phosphoribosyltransferase
MTSRVPRVKQKSRPADQASGKVLVSARRIARRLDALAREVEEAFAGPRGRRRPPSRLLRPKQGGGPLVVVGVLKGAFVFTADFVRKLNMPHRVEFVRVRSYRGKTRGRVRVEGPNVTGLRGRDVLVLDGVLDTGRTLRAVLRRLGQGRPRRLKVCALLRKRRPGQLAVPLDFVGFEIPDVFVVGYGMDCAEEGRNFRDIVAL